MRLYNRRKSAKTHQDISSVVQPDLCIVCDLSKLDDNGCLGAPDLVVEILAKGNSTRGLKIKKQLYEESGVREYWIVDPEHEYALQFSLTDDGVYSSLFIYVKEDTLNSVVFPDLRTPLEEIFVRGRGMTSAWRGRRLFGGISLPHVSTRLRARR